MRRVKKTLNLKIVNVERELNILIYVSSKAEDEKGAFIREVLPRVIATLDLENNGKVCASTMTKLKASLHWKMLLFLLGCKLKSNLESNVTVFIIGVNIIFALI